MLNKPSLSKPSLNKLRLSKPSLNTLSWSGLFLVSLVAIGVVSAQQRPALTPEQTARLQIQEVPGKAGLYIIPGFDGNMSGGNVAVRVTDAGILIVDNKFADSFGEIMRQVRKISDAPVRYVMNTHSHFDHAGSNADFLPTAQVIGHENARANMIRNGEAGPPNLTYDGRTSVFVGDAEVQAHYFGRGHTSGDSLVYFPDLRTVHTGDLVLWGERMDGSTLSPFIDFANGGSALEWTATLDGLLSLDFDTVIPGHGPILTRANVEEFQDKFARLMLRMTRLVESGVSRDAIVTELDLSDLNWPLAPDRIQAIYDEVSSAN